MKHKPIDDTSSRNDKVDYQTDKRYYEHLRSKKKIRIFRKGIKHGCIVKSGEPILVISAEEFANCPQTLLSLAQTFAMWAEDVMPTETWTMQEKVKKRRREYLNQAMDNMED
jgi:hypothetical protein